MSEQDMDTILAGYLQAGEASAFSGGLASYRVADINWHIGEAYATNNIDVPAMFVAGKQDPVMASVTDATLMRMQSRIPDLRGNKIIANAGHFVQMEQTEETSAAIVLFLKSLD